jgi:hypothetical protein
MQVDGISPDRTCHVDISALVLAADPTRTAVSISVGSLLTDRCEVKPHIVEAVLNHIGGHKAVVAGVSTWTTQRGLIRSQTWLSLSTQWSRASPTAAPAPQAAKRRPRH